MTTPSDSPDASSTADGRPPGAPGSVPLRTAAADLGVDRQSVHDREVERFGGLKIGAAFFGFMATVGVAALLTSLLSGTGVVLSLSTDTTVEEINQQADQGTSTAQTIGLAGAITLLVAIALAYFCGGYVAGRMARFSGTKQGLAVWLWSVVFAVVVAILVLIFGNDVNVLANLNLPRIPVDEGDLTTAGIIAIVAVVLVSLGAALLGGKIGMAYHRRVDRTGLQI